MSDFEKQVAGAADYVADHIDRAVDTVGGLLTGESGKKVAGGAAIGALVAVFLPVSLVGGALLGAGYAVLRQVDKGEEPHKPE